MIIILPLNGTSAEQFENYNELFESLTTIENEKYPNSMQMNWRFIVYSPKQVAALYADTQDLCTTVQEAFEEHLPLIEICAGDYKTPLYIVLTPNVDMDYLKKKWCIDYCTFHNLLVKEV